MSITYKEYIQYTVYNTYNKMLYSNLLNYDLLAFRTHVIQVEGKPVKLQVLVDLAICCNFSGNKVKKLGVFQGWGKGL